MKLLHFKSYHFLKAIDYVEGNIKTFIYKTLIYKTLIMLKELWHMAKRSDNMKLRKISYDESVIFNFLSMMAGPDICITFSLNSVLILNFLVS